MTKAFSLWSCEHQTMESIIPEEGFKRWEEAGTDSFLNQMQDLCSFHS